MIPQIKIYRIMTLNKQCNLTPTYKHGPNYMSTLRLMTIIKMKNNDFIKIKLF